MRKQAQAPRGPERGGGSRGAFNTLSPVIVSPSEMCLLHTLDPGSHYPPMRTRSPVPSLSPCSAPSCTPAQGLAFEACPTRPSPHSLLQAAPSLAAFSPRLPACSLRRSVGQPCVSLLGVRSNPTSSHQGPWELPEHRAPPASPALTPFLWEQPVPARFRALPTPCPLSGLPPFMRLVLASALGLPPKVTSSERPFRTTVPKLALPPRQAPPLLLLSFQHLAPFCSLFVLCPPPSSPSHPPPCPGSRGRDGRICPAPTLPGGARAPDAEAPCPWIVSTNRSPARPASTGGPAPLRAAVWEAWGPRPEPGEKLQSPRLPGSPSGTSVLVPRCPATVYSTREGRRGREAVIAP